MVIKCRVFYSDVSWRLAVMKWVYIAPNSQVDLSKTSFSTQVHLYPIAINKE